MKRCHHASHRNRPHTIYHEGRGPGVLAYPVIFCAYGFWLPNDPRGSWSDFVWAWELRRFGPATKSNTRRSVAHDSHDADLRSAAKQALKYPPVVFTGSQALAIAAGFAHMIAKSGYVVYACSILPEHVHMVIARHTYKIENLVGFLKADATRALADADLHPLAGHRNNDGTIPTPWAEKCWKVHLDTDDDITRAIQYVEQNPIKEGKRPRSWPFVVSYGSSTAAQPLPSATPV